MDFTVRCGQLLVEFLDLGLEGGDVGVVLAFLGAQLVAQCRIDGGAGIRCRGRAFGDLRSGCGGGGADLGEEIGVVVDGLAGDACVSRHRVRVDVHPGAQHLP